MATEQEFWTWLGTAAVAWELNALGQIRVDVPTSHATLFSGAPDVRVDVGSGRTQSRTRGAPDDITDGQRSRKAPADPLHVWDGMTLQERDASPWALRIVAAANRIPGYSSALRASLLTACGLQEP